jgi:type I restriction enzyme S subunit|nr:MAG TPA: hypothetical protein [Caudoviricetes sp.]
MKRTIGEIAEIVMGQSPKSEFYNNNGDGMPFLQGNRTFGDLYPTFDTYTTNPTKTAKAGDIIMSVRAPVGDLNITPVDMCLGRGVCALRMKNGNQSYLFYLLKHNVKTLINRESGTVFGSVNYKDIASLLVDYEENEEEQRRIGQFLWDIDQKIETNKAINNNLMQQTQTLYESIFCTPSDIVTKHISLSELMDYAGGSQPPASEFVFSPKDGYIRFVQIRDYDTDGHITFIPHSNKNKLCEEHDIMIARYGASLGRICFGINGAYNVALAKVFPKKPYFREFLRCYLSSRTFYDGINNKGGRSAQAGFNQSDINSFEFDFPVDETIVKEFELTAAPMFEQRLQLKKENQRLSSLRDTILPKLMSGEIDVSDVEF